MSDTRTRPGVTFIGVGAIGLPMAERIARAGHAVTAVEPGEAQRERAASSGLSAVPALTQDAIAPLIIVMVATPGQLDAVVDAAVQLQVADTLWVVMSTVGPASVEAASERLTAAGAAVLDAPVTGGVAGARAGTLRIFCSGRPDDVEAARAVLECCGVVEVVGAEPGRGQAVKVVNQHLCTVHLVAAAEALALARDLGLDPEVVLDLVSKGAAGSWMLADRGPRMLSDGGEVTSSVGIFVKDSQLVADAAAQSGADVPVLIAARERFLAAERAGLVAKDDSRVYDTYAAPAP